MRPRPGVLCTHTTRAPGVRSAAMSRGVTSEVFHGSSAPRSTTSTIGHPARADDTGNRNSAPPTASTPVTVGHGDVATTRAPARRARSTSTSRACQVGARSSCSDSSCSSTTIAVASPGHGAHAAARAPTTTSTPAAARAHSRGTTATRRPRRASAAPIAAARSTDGITTSAGPSPHAATIASNGDTAGGTTTTTSPPLARHETGEGRRRRLHGHRRRRRRQPDDVRRRAGGVQERAQSPGSPPLRRPCRERHERRVGSERRHRGHRLQALRRHLTVGRVEGDHPAPHAPRVQRHAHDGADRQGDPRRDGVVELLVEAGDVGNDARHPQRGRRPGHTPTAALNSSRRLVCSQVNPGLDRPKWP